jgi:hypothetical protein
MFATFPSYLAFLPLTAPIAGTVCLVPPILFISWIQTAAWSAYAVEQCHSNIKIAETPAKQ